MRRQRQLLIFQLRDRAIARLSSFNRRGLQRAVLVALAVGLATFTLACSGSPANGDSTANGDRPSPEAAETSAREVVDETQEAAEVAGQYAADRANELLDRADAKLQETTEAIDQLKQKAVEADAEAKARLQDRIDELEQKAADLRAQRDEFRDRADDLADRGAESARALGRGLSDALDDLQEATAEARQELTESESANSDSSDASDAESTDASDRS